MKSMLHVTAALCLMTAAGCSSTRFIESGLVEDVGPVSFQGQRVVSMVIHPDAEIRIKAEDALAAELTQRGMTGVASHTFIDQASIRDTDKAKTAIMDSGAAGVVVTRLVGIEQTTKYVDPYDQHYYGTLMSYYDYGWSSVHAAGYFETYNTYVIETLCYRVSDQKLIWRGVSETFAPNSIASLSASLVKEAAKVMKKQGLVAEKK